MNFLYHYEFRRPSFIGGRFLLLFFLLPFSDNYSHIARQSTCGFNVIFFYGKRWMSKRLLMIYQRQLHDIFELGPTKSLIIIYLFHALIKYIKNTKECNITFSWRAVRFPNEYWNHIKKVLLEMSQRSQRIYIYENTYYNFWELLKLLTKSTTPSSVEWRKQIDALSDM